MQKLEKRIELIIKGMACVNCQNTIERGLKATEGILKVSVSYNHGTADIVYDEKKISWNQIREVIEGLGYEVLEDEEQQKSDMVTLICMLLIIVSLYVILQSVGILNLLVPSQLADTKMGYGMLFVIGLITSVHCVAMCGGINLSQCIPRAGDNGKEKKGRPGTFLSAFTYNLGRVFSYTMVGFGLGLVGFLLGGNTEVVLSMLVQGILKMAAGLVMVIMGINMLGLFPELRKFTIRMPKFIAQRIGKKRAGNSRPFWVGVLNGFMPCGPLQSMWIVALAAGNPFAGALSMFLFGLGTVPLMLGLGSIVATLGKRFTDKVMTVGAVLVIVLGLAMMSQGGSLSGWLPPDLMLVLLIAFCIAGMLFSVPVKRKVWKKVINVVSVFVIIGSYILWSHWDLMMPGNTSSDTELKMIDGVQVVNSTLAPGSYPDISVQAGVPVRWIIDAPEGSINGCNYKMIIQDFDMEYIFQTGENVIEFTPTETGTVQYSCWMGMIHGSIICY